MPSPAQPWHIFVENRSAVIAALERGEVDGILPAARGFLDGFAQFLLEHQIVDTLAAFSDPRSRQSNPMAFFCLGLLYKPLFDLPSLAQVGRVLFRSPYILRQLGFNAQQLDEGFYHTQRPKPRNRSTLKPSQNASPPCRRQTTLCNNRSCPRC